MNMRLTIEYNVVWWLIDWSSLSAWKNYCSIRILSVRYYLFTQVQGETMRAITEHTTCIRGCLYFTFCVDNNWGRISCTSTAIIHVVVREYLNIVAQGPTKNGGNSNILIFSLLFFITLSLITYHLPHPIRIFQNVMNGTSMFCRMYACLFTSIPIQQEH